MIFRTALHYLLSRRASRLSNHDVGRVPMRVTLTDLDTLGHVNNGIYFSLMDLGRLDLMIRSGGWSVLSKLGWYPVAASETMTFRKSLQPRQRFILETRIAGYDERSVYIQQRFVVLGEIFAEGFVRARFLKKSGGVVTVDELANALGVDTSERTLPDHVARWGTDFALPSTRQPALSDWA